MWLVRESEELLMWLVRKIEGLLMRLVRESAVFLLERCI